MKLLYFNKLNTLDFTCEFLNLLKSKYIYCLNKNELQKILYYFYLNKDYNELFKYLDIKDKKNFLNSSLNLLKLIKFISESVENKNIIYVTGNIEEKILNTEIKKELEKLVDEYIKILNISNNYENLHLYKINPNILYYKLVDCNNLVDNFKWDIITDGNIKNINDIYSKNFIPDIENENIILYLNDITNKKVVIEGSSYVLNRGIKNNEILKNELYIKEIDENKINDLSIYFNQIKINNEKIKRITL